MVGLVLIVLLFNGLFGLLFVWVLVCYIFFGKCIFDVLVDFFFVLFIVVVGIILVMLYLVNGWIGSVFVELGIKVVYMLFGIIVVMVFISIFFVVCMVQFVLEEIFCEEEEVGMMLGVFDVVVFWKVIFFLFKFVLLVGMVLFFMCSLGEFGVVIFIAGNMFYISEIILLMIFVCL